MFATEAYEKYASLQETANRIWEVSGDCQESDLAQAQANLAFELYEYAAGLREVDY